MNKNYSVVIKVTNKGVKETIGSLAKLQKLLQQTETSAQKLQKSMGNMGRGFSGIDTRITKVSRSFNSLSSTMGGINRVSAKAAASTTSLGEKMVLASIGASKFSGALGAQTGKISLLAGAAKKAAVAVGVAVAAKEMVQLADTYTSFTNRIKIFVEEREKQKAVEQELIEISQRTYLDLGTLSSTWGRLTQSVEGSGRSQREVLTVMENLAKAARITGASLESTKAGLLQFSQGLAAGRLQGDELQSVVENITFAGKLIADYKKTTVGSLKELGAQGEITSQDLIEALLNPLDDLDKRLKEVRVTFAQSMQNLWVALTVAAGGFDKVTGASKLFANVMVIVNKSIMTVGNALHRLSDLWDSLPEAAKATIKLFTGVSLLELGYAGLNATLDKTNSLFKVSTESLDEKGKKIEAAIENTANLVIYNDELQKHIDVLKKGADAYEEFATREKMGKALEGVSDELLKQRLSLEKTKKSWIDFNSRLESLKGPDSGIIDQQVAKLNEAFKSSKISVQAYEEELKRLGRSSYTAADAIRDQTEALKLSSHEHALAAAAQKQLTETGKAMTAAEKESYLVALKNYDSLKLKKDLLASIKGPEQERISTIKILNEALTAGSITQKQYNDRIVELVPSLGRQRDLLEEIKGPEQERILTISTLNSLLSQQSITQEEYNNKMAELVPSLALQRDILQEINGPMEQKAANLAALNELYASGKVSLEQYNDQLIRYDENARRQHELLESMREPWENYRTGMSDLQVLLENTSISEEQFINKQTELRSALAGAVSPQEFDRNFGIFQNSYDKLSKKVMSTGQILGDVFSKGVDMASDAVGNFVKTGRMDFDKFFKELFAHIAALLAKQVLIAGFSMVLNTLLPGSGSAMGFMGGGAKSAMSGGLSAVSGGMSAMGSAGSGIMRGFGGFTGGGSAGIGKSLIGGFGGGGSSLLGGGGGGFSGIGSSIMGAFGGGGSSLLGGGGGGSGLFGGVGSSIVTSLANNLSGGGTGGLFGAATRYATGGGSDRQINVKIVNVMDRDDPEADTEGSEDEKVILNIIKRNADEVRELISF